eukprot:767910_1
MMQTFVCTKLTSNYEDSLNYIIAKHSSIPEPKGNEILVKIHAAGLNFFDGLILESKYQHRQTPPFIPCSEFSGVIVKLGSNRNNKFQIGDRVCGSALRHQNYGSLSEYTICSEASRW